MNRFEWTNAASLAEAANGANSTLADVMVATTRRELRGRRQGTTEGIAVLQPIADTRIVKAGGVDLLDLMKEGLVAPSRLVNILRVPGLNQMRVENGVLRIGALVTLAQIAADENLRRTHTALVEAAFHIATPQIRNSATAGGNLLQRPKCWYFRHEAFPCRKKGGEECYAIEGENEFLGVFDNRVCAATHPSTLATPLVAMNAEIVLTNNRGASRTVKLEEFFTSPTRDATRENTLQPGEILTEIRVPVLAANTRSWHIKQGEKESFDWALTDVAVVLEGANERTIRASIVLGAVAPVPLRARSAENFLVGKAVTPENALAAARLAVEGATPLSQNAHKLPIITAVVRRTILQAAGIDWNV